MEMTLENAKEGEGEISLDGGRGKKARFFVLFHSPNRPPKGVQPHVATRFNRNFKVLPGVFQHGASMLQKLQRGENTLQH